MNLLKACPSVTLAGEAATGAEAVALILAEKPDLALLDLQMPDGTGLEVVRRLPEASLPLVAFVTAFDDYAVEAFELNAIDYLLKPVEQARLEATLTRARERMGAGETASARAAALNVAARSYEQASRRAYIERIPVRKRDEVLILPTRQIASIVAEAELLHLTTVTGERHTINHRLHALETRLDPRRFIRLGRGILANVDQIARVVAMPGGTFEAVLHNGQTLPVSRIQARVLRETLLRL